MCGIAGIAGSIDRTVALSSVRTMVDTLARRGPDGEGLEVCPGAILGHRRLAIFDLSQAGRQPMVSPDGAVSVVFNGAIYNFRELRAELESRHYAFRSATDTEVLVHGYREWGLDGLVPRLRGMFAFGLWDASTQKLFLVRDRLGVKPLVYATRAGQIAFASNVRALREAGFVHDLDAGALAEYLEFGFVTDARAIYRGAVKVPAASIVEWSDGAARTREYWSPPTASDNGRPSFEEVVHETERLFLRAVEQRLAADVPVGALLSGGVDSSLVCWAIAHFGATVTAFTVGVPGDPWDETSDARATARSLKLQHQVLELSAPDPRHVAELTSAYAEPFACASAIGMLRISEAVRASATVLLTGDGGDDVFLGYPEHRTLWLAGKLARTWPGAVANYWGAHRGQFPRVGVLRRVGSFLDYTAGGIAAVAAARDGFPFYQRAGLLGERLASATIAQRTLAWSHDSARRVLADFLDYDRQTRFVAEYLTKVDGATMYHGLEARSPFLDQELWEFAASLPLDVRLHRGRLKAILRELARRRIGPRVARRPKSGFGVPVQRWIAGGWRRAVETTFRDSILEREGWIRANPVLRVLEDSVSERWAPLQLWYLFILESWLRHETHARTEAQMSRDPGLAAGSRR